MPSGDLLSKKRSTNKKEGLGYVPMAKKKKNKKKKAKPAQAKKNTLWVVMPQGAMPPPMTLRDILTPTIFFMCDYYGDVYAKYVGPYDGYHCLLYLGSQDPCC